MAASCCSVADGIFRRWDETVREVAVRRVTDGALREMRFAEAEKCPDPV
jgi:hypothetical protein